MKTIAEISDALFRRAMKHCAEMGLALRGVIKDRLRRILESSSAGRPLRLKASGFRGGGQVDPSDWPAVREIIYEGRGGKPRDRR